jgi:hypothetical protein
MVEMQIPVPPLRAMQWCIGKKQRGVATSCDGDALAGPPDTKKDGLRGHYVQVSPRDRFRSTIIVFLSRPERNELNISGAASRDVWNVYIRSQIVHDVAAPRSPPPDVLLLILTKYCRTSCFLVWMCARRLQTGVSSLDFSLFLLFLFLRLFFCKSWGMSIIDWTHCVLCIVIPE